MGLLKRWEVLADAAADKNFNKYSQNVKYVFKKKKKKEVDNHAEAADLTELWRVSFSGCFEADRRGARGGTWYW